SNSKYRILLNKMPTSCNTNRKRKRLPDSNSSINDTFICIEDECFMIANFPGKKKRLYCKNHVKDGMINVMSSKLCIEPGCDKYSSFNFPGKKKRLYCKKHAKDGMVNILNKFCI